MAIETLIRAVSEEVVALMRAASQEVLAPLHQPGCKITRGAGITLPPPSLKDALMLVQQRRASSRILQPIAATRIQRAWADHVASQKRTRAMQTSAAAVLQVAWRSQLHSRRVMASERAAAATILQSAWRCHVAVRTFAARRQAQLRIASVARGAAQRRAYRRQLADVVGPLARIQAAVRAWLWRRRYEIARRAALLIESTWRRVRSEVLRRRLARAANALRHGGRLSKYRRGGKHERHQRYAWVSDDLQQLFWSPVTDRYDEEGLKLRTIPMASITAVCEGVKTTLLKKMERRAAEPQRLLSFTRRKPLALDEGCAFSVICRERVIDFYADDKPTRDAWLRDLQTALTYAHTYDHKAAMAAVQKLSAESAPVKASDSDTEDDEQ